MRDQNTYGGGLIELIKKGLICKRLKTFETVNSECICSELTISNKKWVCHIVYHLPPIDQKKSTVIDKIPPKFNCQQIF